MSRPVMNIQTICLYRAIAIRRKYPVCIADFCQSFARSCRYCRNKKHSRHLETTGQWIPPWLSIVERQGLEWQCQSYSGNTPCQYIKKAEAARRDMLDIEIEKINGVAQRGCLLIEVGGISHWYRIVFKHRFASRKIHGPAHIQPIRRINVVDLQIIFPCLRQCRFECNDLLRLGPALLPLIGIAIR